MGAPCTFARCDMACYLLSIKQKSLLSGGIFFFYSKFRISGWEDKTANFVGVNWLVSYVDCWAITSDFGVGA